MLLNRPAGLEVPFQVSLSQIYHADLICLNMCFFCILYIYRSPALSAFQEMMPVLWSSAKVNGRWAKKFELLQRVTSGEVSSACLQCTQKTVRMCVLVLTKCVWVTRRKLTFFSSERIIHNQRTARGKNMKCAKTRAYCLPIAERPSGSCAVLTGSLAKKESLLCHCVKISLH